MNILTQMKNAWAKMSISMMSEQSRLSYIETYDFSAGLRAKFAQSTPALDDQQQGLVFEALREYFVVCLRAHSAMVSMPSQIVDKAWHEFILFTKDYEEFCAIAFGHFLHHTPAAAMINPTSAQSGIQRTWRLACSREGINPRAPDRLPLIFSIDDQLNIENGFIYALDCMAEKQKDNRKTYCATHIDGFSSVDGGNVYGTEANAQSGEPGGSAPAPNPSAHHGPSASSANAAHSGHGADHGSGHSTAGDAGAGHSGHSCGGHSCGGHSCGGHGCGGGH